MLTPVVLLLLAMQTQPPVAAVAGLGTGPSESLSTQLSARGVRMLVSASVDDTPRSRSSRTADRCFSAGEAETGGQRVCLYTCGGTEAALPVPAERSCPVSYRPAP